MAATGTCPICGKRIVGVPRKINDRAVCGSCYQQEVARLAAAEREKAETIRYIKELFGKTECPIPVQNSIDRAVSSGKEMKWIRYAIYYHYEILGHVPDDVDDVPWVIRDYYDEARKYRASMDELAKENAKIDLTSETEVVKIERPTSKSKYRRFMQLEEEEN